MNRCGISGTNPNEVAREAAAKTRRIMLSRGLQVRDEGEKIVLETATGSGMVPSDERITHIQESKREMGQNQEPDEGTIALNIRAASKDVYPRWSIPDGDGDPGESEQRAIEAQIAAAVSGRKPLYFEPWGEEFSDAFAESYRGVIPEGVEVTSRDGMLFIYRKEAVRPLLNSDPEFYRPNGESDIEAIVKVSSLGMNGELLGYGAKCMMTRPAHAVRIFKGEKILMYYFVSDPDPNHAAVFAQARTDDFELAFGWKDLRFTLEKMD